MNRETRFATLQAKWRDADQAVSTLRNELDRRYQSYRYAPIGKQRELKRLQARASKAFDRFWTFAEPIASRDWRCGVPCAYIRDRVTFAEWVTREAITVPPPAYGSNEANMREFAREVR